MITAVRHDDDVATEQDPHGLLARMRRLHPPLKQRDLVEMLGISRNTVSRAIRTEEPSDYRETIASLLDRLEREGRPSAPSGPQLRRSSDTPERRALEALIETRQGEQVAIRLLGDGTRAIFVVPEGGRIPSDDEIERALREARGE